jgi:hypothetical protein
LCVHELRVHRTAGYDRDLDLVSARSFILSIHSTCKVSVSRQQADDKLLEEAIERPIVAFGKQKVRLGLAALPIITPHIGL